MVMRIPIHRGGGGGPSIAMASTRMKGTRMLIKKEVGYSSRNKVVHFVVSEVEHRVSKVWRIEL